jgi:hypothetical protein
MVVLDLHSILEELGQSLFYVTGAIPGFLRDLSVGVDEPGITNPHIGSLVLVLVAVLALGRPNTRTNTRTSFRRWAT